MSIDNPSDAMVTDGSVSSTEPFRQDCLGTVERCCQFETERRRAAEDAIRASEHLMREKVRHTLELQDAKRQLAITQRLCGTLKTHVEFLEDQVHRLEEVCCEERAKRTVMETRLLEITESGGPGAVPLEPLAVVDLPSYAKEGHLLALLEQSGAAYSELLGRYEETSAQAAQLQQRVSELQGRCCFLEQQVTSLQHDNVVAAREKQGQATNAAKVTSAEEIMQGEKNDRAWIGSQANVGALQLAYQCTRGSIDLVTAHFRERLDTLVRNRSYDQREHELELRQASERLQAELRRQVDAVRKEGHEEENRLRCQCERFQMENDLLAKNCDLWRAQCMAKDQQHAATIAAMKQDGEMRIRQRDAVIGDKEKEISQLLQRIDALLHPPPPDAREIAEKCCSRAVQTEGRSDLENEAIYCSAKEDALQELREEVQRAKEAEASANAQYSALQKEFSRLEWVVVGVEQQKQTLAAKHASELATVKYELDALQGRLESSERVRKDLQQELADLVHRKGVGELKKR
jgi:predicted  nucleic acid-binding Zn-ribbon protein